MEKPLGIRRKGRITETQGRNESVTGPVFTLFFLVPLIGGTPQLVFGKDGYIPNEYLRVMFWGSLTAAGILVGIYSSTLWKLQSEYDAHKNARQNSVEKQVAPIPEKPEESTQTERQWRIAEYERRGFRKSKMLQFSRTDVDGAEKIVLADLFIAPPPEEPSDTNLWFRRASLVYEDGSAVDMKAAVLYGDEAWKQLSHQHVAQKRRGRPVHIEKAINRPLIQTNLTQSHYAVCLGLASAQGTQPASRNEELSDDRSVNLCRAVVNLGFKQSSDVLGLSLGVARTEKSDKDLQARQRALVIVGVDVLGDDLHMRELIRTATDVIRLDGVAISDYSRSHNGYTLFRNVSAGEYVGAYREESSEPTETPSAKDKSFFYLKGRSE